MCQHTGYVTDGYFQIIIDFGAAH